MDPQGMDLDVDDSRRHGELEGNSVAPHAIGDRDNMDMETELDNGTVTPHASGYMDMETELDTGHVDDAAELWPAIHGDAVINVYVTDTSPSEMTDVSRQSSPSRRCRPSPRCYLHIRPSGREVPLCAHGDGYLTWQSWLRLRLLAGAAGAGSPRSQEGSGTATVGSSGQRVCYGLPQRRTA